MGILNCLKTDNETIAVTFRACDPSPLEEGSRDGYTAKMLSTRSCPMETRKKVISENGMRHWIRNNLVEILNATFLHDLTLDPWTGNQAIFTPWALASNSEKVWCPQGASSWYSPGICRMSCIRTHALFSFPNPPVSR